MVIAHNILASNAQRQYNIVMDKRKKTSEKLSSGYRINRASDDAAGLNISEKMRFQIRGLNRASDNIQDGISFVQVADGALSEVQTMIHRIKELSVQSANDTNTDEDRAALDKEVQQIKAEMSSIFNDTMFNTRKIWDGTIINVNEVTKYRDVSAVTYNASSVNSTITNQNKWAMPSSSFRLNADNNGIKISWTGYNGNTYTSNNIAWDAELAGTHSFKLSDYMDTSTFPETTGIEMEYSYTVHSLATKADVIAALNGANVSSYISTSEYTLVSTYSGNAADRISFSTSLQYSALLKSDKDMEANDTRFIEAVKNGSGEYENINNPAISNSAEPFKFTFDVNNVGPVTATYSSGSYSGSTNEPDNGIWWVWRTNSSGGRYKSTVSYTPSPNNGGMDSIFNAVVNDSANQGLSNSNNGGSLTMTFNLTDSSGNNIGRLTASIGIRAGETTDSVKQRLADIKAVDIYDNANPSTMRAYRTSATKSSNKIKEPYKELEYVFSDDNTINIQSGAITGNSFAIEYENMSLEYIGLANTQIDDNNSASDAISQVDIALEKVSAQRSLFGAYQNRMEHAMEVDKLTSENTQTAESKLRDANMANEICDYSKFNILAQAGQAIIAQANQINSNILSILR